jgi:enoyl-CoA hydratase/carnithine racemase
MLELLMHCHYLISVDTAQLGMPEVTLPVVPGMEGCHWLFRKTEASAHGRVLDLLLSGKSLAARDAAGWLVDYAGPMEEALRKAWLIVTGGEHGLPLRRVRKEPLEIRTEVTGELTAGNPLVEAGRAAIMQAVRSSCSVSLDEALDVQARHSAGFMARKECAKGAIGSAARKLREV